MRVLVTGATGVVGGGIARALLAGGHAVTGLARSPEAAGRLAAVGVTPLPGDLEDAAVLTAGAQQADAVVHAGFPRDAYAHLDAAVALDRHATGVLAMAAGRLLYVSGIGVMGAPPGGVVDDDTPPNPPPQMRWRFELERDVLAAGGQVVRPVFVHGRGEGDILRSLVRTARTRGEAVHTAPGTNPWPTVHVDDLGDAVAAAVTTGEPGLCVNVAAGETTPQALVAHLGELLGVPSRAVPAAEADQIVPYARWLDGSFRVRALRARDALGWRPHRPGLLDDLATYLD